jgi:hypothetical protein
VRLRRTKKHYFLRIIEMILIYIRILYWIGLQAGDYLMSIYTPIKKFLSELPARQTDIILTFEQIEHILNDRLPPSAFQYPAWWENEKGGSHVQAHAWLNAGWKVGTADLEKKWVKFIRQ